MAAWWSGKGTVKKLERHPKLNNSASTWTETINAWRILDLNISFHTNLTNLVVNENNGSAFFFKQ